MQKKLCVNFQVDHMFYIEFGYSSISCILCMFTHFLAINTLDWLISGVTCIICLAHLKIEGLISYF